MYFVFDIETIPDLDLIRAAVKDPSDEDSLLMEQAAEQIAKNKTGFMPPMFQRIVAWVGLWIENTGEPRNKLSWSGEDEETGIKKLIEALVVYKDFDLIHHNGKGFDLPVISYRAMKHGIQLPARLSHQDIKYRFSKKNVDLVDEFSNYGASAWPKLKHLGLLIGIPFKQTGEGDAVDIMFKAGKLEQIEHYCYEDVMATYLVWLHLKFTNGDMDTINFQNLKERAMLKLTEIQHMTKS